MLDSCIAPFFPEWARERARARYQFEAWKNATSLATFEAAEFDRTNRDWLPRRGSADQAILGDFHTLLNRARSLERDNWAAASILKAFQRNVWGRYILNVSDVRKKRQKDGSRPELESYNEAVDTLFAERWSTRRRHCDAIQRQSYWAKCSMAVKELISVGEHFIVDTYQPNEESVGFRLQSFEPEQLDVFKLQDPTTGNYIRMGVEVDDIGTPVAYHFFKRPLNDWFPFLPASVSGSIFEASIRVPADRVMHLTVQDRTQQSHGYSWLTPVMSKLRHTVTTDQAMALAARVEASIVASVTRETAGESNAYGATSLPPKVGDVYDSAGNPTGQTTRPDTVSNSGGRQWPFEPAMVFEGRPGEKVTFPDRKQAGGNYDDFMKMQLRASAAGTGTSYDEVARDFDGGNYSSKRQNSIEGRRGYAVVQDRVIEEVCRPVHERFVMYAIMEDCVTPGRWDLGVKLEEYLDDPLKWSSAEFIPDGRENIDALKEGSADSISLDKRLDSRKRIIARRYGIHWRRMFYQIADEYRLANTLKITLPDVEPIAPRNAGDEAPEQDPDQNDNDKADEDEKKTEPKGEKEKRASSAGTFGG